MNEEKGEIQATVLMVPANTPVEKFHKYIDARHSLCFSQFLRDSYIPSPEPYVYFTNTNEFMIDKPSVIHMHMARANDMISHVKLFAFYNSQEAFAFFESCRKLCDP